MIHNMLHSTMNAIHNHTPIQWSSIVNKYPAESTISTAVALWPLVKVSAFKHPSDAHPTSLILCENMAPSLTRSHFCQQFTTNLENGQNTTGNLTGGEATTVSKLWRRKKTVEWWNHQWVKVQKRRSTAEWWSHNWVKVQKVKVQKKRSTAAPQLVKVQKVKVQKMSNAEWWSHNWVSVHGEATIGSRFRRRGALLSGEATTGSKFSRRGKLLSEEATTESKIKTNTLVCPVRQRNSLKITFQNVVAWQCCPSRTLAVPSGFCHCTCNTTSRKLRKLH